MARAFGGTALAGIAADGSDPGAGGVDANDYAFFGCQREFFSILSAHDPLRAATAHENDAPQRG
jgi:hypothetical protein